VGRYGSSLLDRRKPYGSICGRPRCNIQQRTESGADGAWSVAWPSDDQHRREVVGLDELHGDRFDGGESDRWQGRLDFALSLRVLSHSGLSLHGWGA
jgi:hypothetical protein